MQRSGTFFGFILGLFCGLALAAAVAFFLLRSSPFAKKEEPQQDQSPRQIQVISSGQSSAPSNDPNQSLYGNQNASQQHPDNNPPTGQASISEPATAPVPAPTPVPVQSHLATAPIPAVNTHSSSSKASTTPSKTNTAQPIYLQAGAFRDHNQAETQRGNLALMGFSSQILPANTGSTKIYRVRLGPFQNTNIASIQAKLKNNGITTTIIR